MKFGWLSDTHLDTVQYGMERRRADFEIAFEYAVNDMLAHQIKVILHSGDLINSNRPSPRTMKFLRVMNARLIEAGAVMYVVSGNHDRTDPHWIETVSTAGWQGIQLFDFRYETHHGIGFDVSFYGVPSMSPEQFRKHEFPKADVLVMHQMVREFVEYEQNDCISISDIPLKYCLIAIGDVHIYRLMPQPGRPNYVMGYPGSTEMKSETEDGEKFWVECELNMQKVLTLTPHRIKTRDVLRVNLDHKHEDPQSMDTAISLVKSWVEEHGDNDPGFRHPIIFITYLNTLTDVMPKFKTAFDPDKFILRFKPIFGKQLKRTPEGVLVEDPDNMTVEDILRGELSSQPELFGIALQMIKPDVDPNAAIDEYINSRLVLVKEATDIKHI